MLKSEFTDIMNDNGSVSWCMHVLWLKLILHYNEKKLIRLHIFLFCA